MSGVVGYSPVRRSVTGHATADGPDVTETAPPPPEPVAEPVPESLRALEEAVKRLNPDDMTPKEALDALYSLRDVHKPDL